MTILTIDKLTKKFSGKFTLNVDNISIRDQETVAILGSNGSGKSTLFELITGNQDPSSGEIELDKMKVSPENTAIKRKIGYLPQAMHLPLWVTPKELLNYSATLFEVKGIKQRVKESMETWDCISYANKPIASCSYGMKKRVGLALATIHDPNFLILDEPFSGLDLTHINILEKIIKERKSKGKINLISTHTLSFVAEFSDRAFIIKNGQIQELHEWKNIVPEQKIALIKKHFPYPAQIKKV